MTDWRLMLAKHTQSSDAIILSKYSIVFWLAICPLSFNEKQGKNMITITTVLGKKVFADSFHICAVNCEKKFKAKKYGKDDIAVTRVKDLCYVVT